MAKIVTAKEFSFRAARFRSPALASKLSVQIWFVLPIALDEVYAREVPMVVPQGANALIYPTRVQGALVQNLPAKMLEAMARKATQMESSA